MRKTDGQQKVVIDLSLQYEFVSKPVLDLIGMKIKY